MLFLNQKPQSFPYFIIYEINSFIFIFRPQIFCCFWFVIDLFIFGFIPLTFVYPLPLTMDPYTTMDLSIQHYKEHNGTEDSLQQHPGGSLAMRTEWEPCLAHHPPLQSFTSCDADLSSGERGPPPPPPSKRRFRSPTSLGRAGKSGSTGDATMMGGSGIPIDERHSGGGKGIRDTLMGRQVSSLSLKFLLSFSLQVKTFCYIVSSLRVEWSGVEKATH